MPVNPLMPRHANGIHQNFLEKKRPTRLAMQKEIDRIARSPNPDKQLKADALLNILLFLSSISRTGHHFPALSPPGKTIHNIQLKNVSNTFLWSSSKEQTSLYPLSASLPENASILVGNKSFFHAVNNIGKSDERQYIRKINKNTGSRLVLSSTIFDVCTSDTLVNSLEHLYRIQTKRDPIHKRDVFNYIRGYVAEKECLLAWIPRYSRSKRAYSTLMSQAAQLAAQEYYKNNCLIRTKTQAGTLLGYSLLVAGEYLRNPFRGAAENLNDVIFPEHPMSENLVMVSEGVNILHDVGFGLVTGGVYPLARYLMAKTLSVVGQIVEGDEKCIKREFSPEALAELLFQYDGGITATGMANKKIAKPHGLSDVSTHTSSSLLLQEHIPSSILTETHLEKVINGVKYRIKEKHAGHYVASCVNGESIAISERPIFFQENTKKWKFSEDGVSEAEHDFELVIGEQLISLYGDTYPVQHNTEIKTFEIAVQSNGKSLRLPVYKTKLGKVWHLANELLMPIYNQQRIDIIRELRVEYSMTTSYLKTANQNHLHYGNGIIYEVRQAGEMLSDPTSLYVIEMYDDLVPVRAMGVPGRGICYHIFDSNHPERAGYPIAFDGWRWIFEPPTSLNVAQQLESQDKLNFFSHEQTSLLSAPDRQGLQWDDTGLKFLKVNGNYLKIKGEKHELYITDRNSVSLKYPVAVIDSSMPTQAGVSLNSMSSKVTIENVPIWDLDWKNSELNELDLLQVDGFNRPLYRVDRTARERVLSQGFAASEDFTAVHNMISDSDALIVSESLEGARRYNTLIKNSFIYKIDGRNAQGVSLKQNYLLNKVRLAWHLDVELEGEGSLDEFIDGTGGAIFLDEAHIRLRDIHPEDISVVTKEELEQCPVLTPGIWQRYLKK